MLVHIHGRPTGRPLFLAVDRCVDQL